MSSENISFQDLVQGSSETFVQEDNFNNDVTNITNIDEEWEGINKLNLLFSRCTTDRCDRKKVELFWKYFDMHIDAEELLRNSVKPYISEENTRGQSPSSEWEGDPCLFGSIQGRNVALCDNPNTKTLELLKSHHLDKVALVNLPQIAKTEGSPVLADEIVNEDKAVVMNAIETFDDMVKNRKNVPIKRSDCKRPSYVKINRLGLKNIQ